ncbi:Cas10/Cmr2 second palm domain-containing protein [Suttonella ornithocola]|nr:hypothetical protein [Suttonella ornithocola]
MSDINKQPIITQGLAEFTQKVPDIVANHNGFLIYAGGDDVLAILPLEDALDCAKAVRIHYQDCFKDKPVTTSISAAIIYAHINAPLKNLLHKAHQVLDDDAKAAAGRDALAVHVYKGSGPAVQWAKKWDDALNTDGDYYLNAIQAKLIRLNSDSNDSEEGIFSSKFLYQIRHRFSLFKTETQTLSDENNQLLTDLLCADFIQSARGIGRTDITLKMARELIQPLLAQCKNPLNNNHIDENAALLVRFLAQKGIERGANA